MYKTIVRAMIKRDITALTGGDHTPLRRKVASDAELEAFAQRFVAERLRLDVEDMVALIEARWGKIHRWEDFLDTERVHDWDDRIEAGPAPPPKHVVA